MDASYKPEQIEQNARDFWEEERVFEVAEDAGKDKFYCVTMLLVARPRSGTIRNQGNQQRCQRVHWAEG